MTTDAAGRRTIGLSPPYQAKMQVQALTQSDILQVGGLNQQGSTHVIYISGRVEGIVRKDNRGGDIINLDNKTWLVTAVLEDWPTWSKVSVTLQA